MSNDKNFLNKADELLNEREYKDGCAECESFKNGCDGEWKDKKEDNNDEDEEDYKKEINIV